MSEMEWEGPPEVHVPRVRDWFTGAFDKWTTRSLSGIFGGGNFGGFVLRIVFFPLWMLFIFLRLAVYFAGLVVMILAEMAWVPAELITYRHRLKREVLRVYGPYMGELHGKTPPPIGA